MTRGRFRRRTAWLGTSFQEQAVSTTVGAIILASDTTLATHGQEVTLVRQHMQLLLAAVNLLSTETGTSLLYWGVGCRVASSGTLNWDPEDDLHSDHWMATGMLTFGKANDIGAGSSGGVFATGNVPTHMPNHRWVDTVDIRSSRKLEMPCEIVLFTKQYLFTGSDPHTLSVSGSWRGLVKLP